MTSLLKLERDRLEAEASSLRTLIDSLDAEDVMARVGLESRLQEVEEEIAALQVDFDRTASVALFFGGAPVVGQRGIQSDFAGAVIGKFQDLVAKLMANMLNPLGERGPVPGRDASTMHITNVVKGSFGFLLEEMNDQRQLVDTRLEQAVQEAGRLLIAFSGEDEDEFENAVADSDERVLRAAKNVLVHLHSNHATMRYLTADIDHAFQTHSLELANVRALTTDLEEELVGLEGAFVGFLPEGHMFEFRTKDETIRGRVSKEIEAAQIMRWNREILDTQVNARFRLTNVLKDGVVARQTYRLLGVAGPIGLPKP